MDAVTYSDSELISDLEKHFVPVRLMSGEHRELSRVHSIRWLPGVVVSDAKGRNHHTSIGFLPPDALAAELAFGRGHALMASKRYEEATRSFSESAGRAVSSERGAEAIYWQGVCELRRTKDFDAALAAWKGICDTYPESLWFQKIGWMLS